MYDTRDMQLLQETLMRYNELINRPYLYELSSFPTASPAPSTLPISLLQLSSFPTSTSPQHFSYILNALNGLRQVVGYIICSQSDGFSLYIGVRGDACSSTPLFVLKSGLEQLFPDVVITVMDDSSPLLTQLFDPKRYTMLSTAISIPPSSFNASSGDSFMSTFFKIMGTGKPYITFFLASPCPRYELNHLLEEVYEIYQILSMFSQSTQNSGKGLARNSSQTITKGNIELNGITTNDTKGTNTSCNQGGYTNITGATPFVCSDKRTINMSVLQNLAKATVNAKNRSFADGTSHSRSNSYSNADLSALNRTENTSISFSIQDKQVQTILTDLTTQIARLQEILAISCFSFSAYFFSASSETALRAAYNFSGLCQTHSPTSMINTVNFWVDSNPHFPSLFEQLQHFDIPTFYNDGTYFSSASLIQSSELVSCLYT